MKKVTKRAGSVVLLAAILALGACGRKDEQASAAVPVTEAPATPAAPAPVELTPEQAARLVRPHSPMIGKPDAPVTIVEFLDPACEGCAAFSPLVKQILFLHPDDVRVVVRFAAFHQGSDEAIRLLDAARQQGKFDETLTALFDRQDEWASHHAPNIDAAWKIAADAGVNIERARRDARSSSVDELLRIDAEDVIAVQIARTPTFFVNGRQPATFGAQQVMDLVAAEVGKAQAARATP
jgi:protein-disulfide isomerase